MKQITEYTTRQLELMKNMMQHDWIVYDDLLNTSDEWSIINQRKNALEVTMAAISLELMIRPR